MTYILWLDESYVDSAELFVLGGFACKSSDLIAISRAWRALKKEMGLQADDELKYTLRQGHPSREKLDNAGWTHKSRVPRTIDSICQLPITIVTTTIDDWRVQPDRRLTDQYGYAFRWVVRGFADEICDDIFPPDGPHMVVVDSPPDLGNMTRDAVNERMRRFFADRGKYAFDLYSNLYENPQTFSLRSPASPLKDLHFSSCLLSAHSKYSDFLQIADVIVGAVRDFAIHFKATSEGEAAWQDENLQRLLAKFRTLEGDYRGFGYFPYGNHHDVIKARIKDLGCGKRRGLHCIPRKDPSDLVT